MSAEGSASGIAERVQAIYRDCRAAEGRDSRLKNNLFQRGQSAVAKRLRECFSGIDNDEVVECVAVAFCNCYRRYVEVETKPSRFLACWITAALHLVHEKLAKMRGKGRRHPDNLGRFHWRVLAESAASPEQSLVVETARSWVDLDKAAEELSLDELVETNHYRRIVERRFKGDMSSSAAKYALGVPNANALAEILSAGHIDAVPLENAKHGLVAILWDDALNLAFDNRHRTRIDDEAFGGDYEIEPESRDPEPSLRAERNELRERLRSAGVGEDVMDAFDRSDGSRKALAEAFNTTVYFLDRILDELRHRLS